MQSCRTRFCLLLLITVSVSCRSVSDSRSEEVQAISLEQPVLVIGADDLRPGHELYQVGGAILSGDSLLIVGNGGTSELRVFSQNGDLVRTISRRGQGPGEIGYLGRFWSVGDTILAFDAVGQKLVYFSHEGELLREQRLDGARFELIGRLRSGEFVNASRDRGGFEKGTSRVDSVTLSRVDPVTGVTSDIVRVPLQTRYAATTPDGGTIFTPLPLEPMLSMSATPTSVVIGYPATPSLTIHRLNGPITSVPLPTSRVELTPGLKEAWLSSMIQRSPSIDPPVMRRYLESLPYTDSLPAYDRVVPYDQDRYWVRQYPLPGEDSTTWSAVDIEGNHLMRFRSSVNLELLHASGGHLVANVPRDDGAEQVVVWQIGASR